MVKQGFHQSCLPTTRSAADDAVLPLCNEAHNRIPNLLRQAARLNQFIGREPTIEFSHRKRRAIDRRRRAYDSDAGAVRQACIEDGILAGEVLSQKAGDTLNRCLQAVVGVRRGERNMLDHAATIRVNAGSPVNHQVGDRRVKQKSPQLLGKERQYQFETHRVAPGLGTAIPDGLGAAAPAAMGSTETRFSWNSVIVKPSGLMNSYCG